MAPATRSNPSTPAKPRPSIDSDGAVTPPARRTPRCTKCHRPRAGHPRSGCPYVDLPSATQIATAPDDGLSEGLSSLHIVSPTEDSKVRAGNTLKRRLSVRFALVPQQTLASLSPTDTQLVEQLLQPGMMNNVVTPADRVAHVLKWRKTLDDPDQLDGPKQEPEAKAESPSNNTVRLPSRRMPCTLSTPSTSLTTTEPVSDQHIGDSAINVNDTIYLLPEPEPDGKEPKKLSRSMSFEERSLFLHQLTRSSNTPPATLLSLPLADLDSVCSDAEKIGFHVRVLPSQEDNYKWVVLGTDEEAINLLAQTFLEEKQRSARAKGTDRKLTAVAGGVVFGAVATWTGLAFS